MRIAVLSYLATYGNAPALTKAFCDLGHDARLILRYRNHSDATDFGFSEEMPCLQIENEADREEAHKWVADADHIVVIGIPSLLWLMPRVLDDPKGFISERGGSVILSSSHLMLGMKSWHREIDKSGLSPAEWNQGKIRESGLSVFVQPHKKTYIGDIKARSWYPPISMMGPNIAPADKIIIGHSPGKRHRWHWKGTKQIQKTLTALHRKHAGIGYHILDETTHNECCEARRGWHICIDQICLAHDIPGQKHYSGGLDKSGLEGMATGCVVITSGGPLTFGNEFPRPPVIVTGHSQLPIVLDSLVQDRLRVEELSKAGREWVTRYCEPKFVANRLLEKR